MGLIDSFLLEPRSFAVWISLRSDSIRGNGSASNPYDGGLAYGTAIPVTAALNSTEAILTTGHAHGFLEGDMIRIAGVSGAPGAQWNKVFGVYDVTPTSFKIASASSFVFPS